MRDAGVGGDIPTTVAERNEMLSDFWFKGYDFALDQALGQVDAELRWQIELKMRGNPHAQTLIDRLQVVSDCIKYLRQPKESA